MTRPDRQNTGVSRDLRLLQSNLERVVHGAEVVGKLLETLHSVAYERGTSGDQVVVTTSKGEWYLDEVGQQRAKELLRGLMKATEHTVRQFEAATADVLNLLSEGGSADASLRGTLLSEVDAEGDVVPGSAQRALKDALAARGRRHQRGEFEPPPIEKQPGIAWRG